MSDILTEMGLSSLDQISAALKLNMAFISDIHLGHPNTPTDFIIHNLETYAFPDNDETGKLDIIFISGDVFDSQMEFDSSAAVAVRAWVARFIGMCVKRGIAVRVLKGTPLHDWDQSFIFHETNVNYNYRCDLKYIDQIHIERIDKFGIDVLYVPDEARATPEQTWDVVQSLLDERGITQVDIGCMHGAFPHQLPNIEAIKDRFHDPDKYNAIVRHFIDIGHIHKHSIHGKILAQGSFDRLSHNEEMDKGHIRVLHGNVQFVKNYGAMRYLTLEVHGFAPEDVLALVSRTLGENRSPGNVRLLCKKGDVAGDMRRRLADIFPFIRFTVERESDNKKKITVEEATKQMRQLPILTRDNILDEIRLVLNDQNPERALRCSKIVENMIGVIS
jgi:hypothetical protein